MVTQRDTGAANDGQGGFSLIEMMIAVVVILVGLVSIVGISVYVSRANLTSNTLNVLAASAQDQVDRLRTAIWTTTAEDPMLAVGGSLSSSPSSPGSSPAMMAASSPSEMAASSPSAGPTEIYSYTLDAENHHHATVGNTPAGDLEIRWQVRQGSTADLRYVTIKVIQTYPTKGVEEGYTVSTIISRN